MTVKRLLFLVICLWLINSLVCFQAANPFEKGFLVSVRSEQHMRAPHSLLVLINRYWQADHTADDPTAEKVNYRYRYLGTDPQNLDHVLYAVATGNCLFSNESTWLFFRSTGHRLKRRILPGEVNFLFRLTPF